MVVDLVVTIVEKNRCALEKHFSRIIWNSLGVNRSSWQVAEVIRSARTLILSYEYYWTWNCYGQHCGNEGGGILEVFVLYFACADGKKQNPIYTDSKISDHTVI